MYECITWYCIYLKSASPDVLNKGLLITYYDWCYVPASRFSRVRLFATRWTVAHQAPLSMGFSRQEYWSGLPCPPSGDLPNPGIEPGPPPSQMNSLLSEPPGKHHFPPQRLINNFIECFSLWVCCYFLMIRVRLCIPS